jgi:ABC-type nitrate/sulfonate/bicarbonate transport system substrate-binding protein
LRNPPTKLVATALLALVAISTALAGCGEKSEDVTPGASQPFDVALDFYVNPDHAGLYQAIERGYFRDAGLDVRPRRSRRSRPAGWTSRFRTSPRCSWLATRACR